MKNKILLIVPPCFVNRELDFEIGLPINLAFLNQSVQNDEWIFEFLDMMLEEKEGYDSFNILKNKLKDPNLRIVGISNHTVRTSLTTIKVAELVKSYREDIKIIVGGVNATFMWRELMERCQSIDYILRAYAQPGLRAFVSSFQTDNVL